MMLSVATVLGYLDPGEPDSGGLGAVEIAAIVVGALVVLALLVLVFRFFLRSERDTRERRRSP
jgi:hypothetical protein